MITEYLRLGWKLCAIPLGQKGPTTPNWNSPENALTEAPSSTNVGLMHAYSGTCAIDIDRVDLATVWLAERGVDIKTLKTAAIWSGKENSGKLIFTLPFPMPSKRVMQVIEGQNVVILEFRCASASGSTVQDVLPPSVHPSGTTYQWVGDCSYTDLALIPVELLNIWSDLLADDTKRSIPMDHATPTSLEEVRSALYSIDPNCDRKTWVDVGMALAKLTADTPIEGFQLFNEWSEGSPDKYPGQNEVAKQWASFKLIPNGIGSGTLFHHAFAAGWQRPTPDISELFKPLPDQPPMQEIVDDMDVRSTMPKLDLSLWPEVLVRRANELSVEVGCDPVVPLLAGLCAVSGAADNRSGLFINPSWRVPPTFWAMTIGDPSDKKSPGSKPMFAPLRKIEFEHKDKHQVELLVWQGKEAQHAAEFKKYREWAASAEAELPNAVPPKVTPLPPEPKQLRLVITDATTQKVVSLAESRPNGFLMHLDEMNKWLMKLADNRNTDDRGCWIQGYETGQYTMDRMGSGSTAVENMALSIYGNCQPTVFRDHLPSMSQDGIVQRFMPVVLNPIYNKMWQEAVPEFLSSAGEYEQLIRRTFALSKADYTMDAAGTALFRSFCQTMLDLREAEKEIGSSDVYRTALGKAEGNCGRLMLLFHLITDPYSSTISAETVSRATRVFLTFFVPSMRYVYLEAGGQKDPLSNSILMTIVQWASVKPLISMSDLRKNLLKKGENKDDFNTDRRIRVAMDEMINLGYVSIHQDHPRYPVWSINPATADVFSNERRKIIARKQFIKGLIKEKGSLVAGKEIDPGSAVGWTPDIVPSL